MLASTLDVRVHPDEQWGEQRVSCSQSFFIMGNSSPASSRRRNAPPAPPTVTNTFVLRNGRYESQALLPPGMPPAWEAGDFSGTVGAQDMNRLWRPLHPPDLKQTQLVKSPIHLKRQLLTVREVQDEKEVGGEPCGRCRTKRTGGKGRTVMMMSTSSRTGGRGR